MKDCVNLVAEKVKNLVLETAVKNEIRPDCLDQAWQDDTDFDFTQDWEATANHADLLNLEQMQRSPAAPSTPVPTPMLAKQI